MSSQLAIVSVVYLGGGVPLSIAQNVIQTIGRSLTRR